MSYAKVGAVTTWAVAWMVALAAAAPLAGQGLANYDYTNLSWRGFGVDWGYLYPTRVNPTQSIGLQMDLGYLGPGVRIVPGITYWASYFKRSEVAKLDHRIEHLITDQTGSPSPPVDLGRIRWQDVALSVDADVVWRVPMNVLTSLGLGVSAHVMNGYGPAVDGTFVQDLLNTVSAGFDGHAGLEVPVRHWIRVYGQARYDFIEHLRYFQFRLGAQFILRNASLDTGGSGQGGTGSGSAP